MLIENIDDFINERIILAGRQISILARTKIQNGDKILIYGLYVSCLFFFVRLTRRAEVSFQQIIFVLSVRPFVAFPFACFSFCPMTCKYLQGFQTDETNFEKF